jgi:hypothetical protein
VLKSLLFFLVASTFILSTKAAAEVFTCTCGNGTPCVISCQCTGAASCGYSKCATRCGTCTQNAMQSVATSLGTGLYETSYISDKRDYSAKDLVADFDEMLKVAPGLKFSEEERQLGVDKAYYVLLRHKHGALNQSVLFPEDYIIQKRTDEFVKMIQDLAPGISKSVQDRLERFGKTLWSDGK